MKNTSQFISNPAFNDDGLRALSEKFLTDIRLELVQGLNDTISGRNQVKKSDITACIIERLGNQLTDNKNVLRFLNSEKVLTPLIKSSAFLRGLDINSDKNILLQIQYQRDYDFAKSIFDSSSLKYLMDKQSAYEILAKSSNANYKYINLVLDQVQCIKRTSGGGDDEIYIGGTKIYYQGQTMIIPKLFVKKFTKDNSTKIFHYSIAKYPIDQQGQFPQLSTAIITLAEQDNENFADFLTKLTQKTRSHVISALANVGIDIGVMAGSVLGPIIGFVIGGLVGLIVIGLISILIDCFRDDIFKPNWTSLYLPSPNTNFNGSLDSPRENYYYADFGGHYKVVVYWQLVTE